MGSTPTPHPHGLRRGHPGLASIPAGTPKPPTPPSPAAPTEPGVGEERGHTRNSHRQEGPGLRSGSATTSETRAQLAASPHPQEMELRLPSACPSGKVLCQVESLRRPEGLWHVSKGNTHRPWQRLYRLRQRQPGRRAPELLGRPLQERPQALQRGGRGEVLPAALPRPALPTRYI